MTAWLRMLGRTPLTEICSVEALGGSTSRGTAERGQSPPRASVPTPPRGEPAPEPSDPRVRQLQRKLKNVEPASRGRRARQPEKPWGDPQEPDAEAVTAESLMESE